MAPRRDALIFQLQQGQAAQPSAQTSAQTSAPARPAPQDAAPRPQAQAPQPQAVTEAAPTPPAPATMDNRPRYYSVHRQAGRQPDATPLPAPNYLNALPVELNETPSSADLAQPPGPPAVMRDAKGRIVSAPPLDGPDLP